MHPLQEKYQLGIQKMVVASKRIAEKGFVTSHGGNLSFRVDDDVILITPTKVPKAEIEFDDIALIDRQGRLLFASEGRKPTGETPFHLDILNRRPDLRGLIHAHPPPITALALVHSDILAKPLVPEP
ncbi:MAG: class II aldolase/adducin family protein, partial [Bacteroidales bacterium]